MIRTHLPIVKENSYNADKRHCKKEIVIVVFGTLKVLVHTLANNFDHIYFLLTNNLLFVLLHKFVCAQKSAYGSYLP